MVIAAFAGSHLKGGTSAVVSEDKVFEDDALDAGRAHDLSDSAGVGLDVGEALAGHVDFVEDEANRGRADCVIGEGIDV